jgi:TetR/AcrR family transcriptional regulator
MVSLPAGRDSSRNRLLAAAAAEFAARGFDGAKVDRIAARARVNKAMLYYHFKNKAALYRAILTDLFGTLAASVRECRAAGGAPDVQIRRFIHTVAAETAARPHFPAIWLREMAEGGRHLDASIVRELASILGVLRTILEDGRRQGQFGYAHPLVTQMGIVAPLLLFAASAPVRERFRDLVTTPAGKVSREAVIAHVERSTLAMLEPGLAPDRVPPARMRPLRSRRPRR